MVFANCTAKKLVNPSTTIRSTSHSSCARDGRQSFPSLQQDGPVCPAPGLVWTLRQPSPMASNQSTILFPQALYKKNPTPNIFLFNKSRADSACSPSQTPAVSDEAPPPQVGAAFTERLLLSRIGIFGTDLCSLRLTWPLLTWMCALIGFLLSAYAVTGALKAAAFISIVGGEIRF